MVSSGLALPDNPEQLILPASSGVQLGMPDEAQVCSCNDVTKADILHAVAEQGCETVADVKAVHARRHARAARACRR